jgi:uncharacterized protein (TIGR02646 family)
MHKLDRTPAPAPPCLSRFKPGLNAWSALTPLDREQIRACLEQMQGRRCAYCEGDLDRLGQHIEHFRSKGNAVFRDLTFAWDNLLWSCDQQDSCGHFKDNGAGPYDVNDLLDPCCDDPDVYFRFRSDGTISVRHGLTVDQHRRATETLRVLGLHPQYGRLRNERKGAVSPFINLAEEAAASGLQPNEISECLKDELEKAANEPFYTAVRHVLIEGA